MATDHMYGMDAPRLLRWILRDLEDGSALGIVKGLFFTPRQEDPFCLTRYGVLLDTPLGAAAGPHTQMAQNLVAAWLTGARYLELKTVQVLDRIAVTKPCIDMKDEGYNCEWSQELTLDHSYAEYLKAWVLIHVLHDRLHARQGNGDQTGRPGVIFNMSAGYSLEGILSPSMQLFLDRMGDAAADIAAMKRALAPVYPRVMDLDIPGCISNNLTMSCMHGCPPDEVESIALYFIEKRGLHTTLKLNPTLLGPDAVRGILNTTLGYPVSVPDLAFEHDIPYSEALRIIKNCLAAAAKKGVTFNVKLTNTLETENTRQSLPDTEKMVYMSGRALHPLSIALAAKLQSDFKAELDLSFCAGVDALNVADTVACGLTPVTVCSDLLKPGGYGRCAQYLENLRSAMEEAGAPSLVDFRLARAAGARMPDGVNPSGAAAKADSHTNLSGDRAAVLTNLAAYAEAVISPGSRYAKTAMGTPDIRIPRPLPALDCAAAPCMAACPAGQDIPGYLERAAVKDMPGALDVILRTNPFPHTLGKICGQTCRKKCMRVLYDEPLRIRDVKLGAAESALVSPLRRSSWNERSVAIVGAGPAGLSCACFLAMAGCAVEIFEASEKAGGRLLGKMTRESGRVNRDVDAILALGVQLHTGRRIQDAQLADLALARDAVYLATGPDEKDTDGKGPGMFLETRMPGNVFLRQFSNGPGERTPSVVESVGEGRRAAQVILNSLGIVRQREHSLDKAGRLDIHALRKRQAFRFDTAKEAKGFRNGIDADACAEEAARCLHCDSYCGMCVTVCPNRANILLRSESRAWPVQEAVSTPEGVRVTTVGRGELRQPWQVVNLGDFCNECGNCAAFCPSSGAPYKDKWRLHLSEASFRADLNGFFQRSPDVLEGKVQGEPFTLRKQDGLVAYEDARLRVQLDGRTLTAVDVELRAGESRASLVHAVEAALFGALLDGDGLSGVLAGPAPSD